MKSLRTLVTALVVVMVCLGVQASAAADVAEDALRATVRVFNGSRSGTAFLVARDEPGQPSRHFLVTAAHVFEDNAPDSCQVVFRTGDLEHGYQRKEVRLVLREDGRPTWLRHPQLDLAAVPIALPADVDAKPFNYRQIARAVAAERGDLRVGQNVLIPCFPAQVEANSAGWPVLRKGSIASYPLRPLVRAQTIFIDYSHFGGDSGAPVVAEVEGQPLVAAVVVAMIRQSDRTVSPFEERVVHTPLGLAIAVQAPYICELLDRWPATR